MPGTSKLSELKSLFSEHGVSRIFLKHLAPHQDNDKNQIMLGSELTNLPFPMEIESRGRSKSAAKRHSKKGELILQAKLNFAWMDQNANLHEAPDAKIIHYQQYPEIRFSGFLNKCTYRPDALRKRNQKKYGKRILIFGVTSGDMTVGFVLTELEDPLVKRFPDVSLFPGLSLIRSLHFEITSTKNPKQLLLSELRAIHLARWHPSITLRPVDTVPIPFKGNQGGGYTLEALLGIPRNAKKGPDKYGFEIKSFSQSATSLITPTADTGVEGRLPFRDFIEKYGWERKNGKGLVFNGTHRVSGKIPKSGLQLKVAGYDQGNDIFSANIGEIEVALWNSNNIKVAGWSFKKLFDSWTKKHAAACYVPYESRVSKSGPDHDKDYFYGSKVFACEGTSIFHLIRSIALGIVYYDPAHDLPYDTKKVPHVRPQWRIQFSENNGEERLSNLYEKVVLMDL